jgi:hypothetical protein
MNLMARLFPPREVRAALDLLSEAQDQLDCSAFESVRIEIENAIFSQPRKFVTLVRKGASLREWVYSMIANVAGDQVESGRYHLYRGLLNPLEPGQDLLRLFDRAVDELVTMGAITGDRAESQKAAIRENIKSVG